MVRQGHLRHQEKAWVMHASLTRPLRVSRLGPGQGHPWVCSICTHALSGAEASFTKTKRPSRLGDEPHLWRLRAHASPVPERKASSVVGISRISSFWLVVWRSLVCRASQKSRLSKVQQKEIRRSVIPLYAAVFDNSKFQMYRHHLIGGSSSWGNVYTHAKSPTACKAMSSLEADE